MLLYDIKNKLPNFWAPMDVYNCHYQVFPIAPYTEEFQAIESQIKGTYYYLVEGIFRIQNPVLYTKFKLKQYEYGKHGDFQIKPLFHDTNRKNVESIAMFNFDWRFAERCRYGPGVYFSASPDLANQRSSRNNGIFRSMFLADVLVQNVQYADHQVFLPDCGFDTVYSINEGTYVKYFDCEYYPNYFINYISATV